MMLSRLGISDSSVPRMAVIGDSLSVGSLSHPEFFWDISRFQKYLSTVPKLDLAFYSPDFQEWIPDPVSGKIEPPTRYWKSEEEDPGADFFTRASWKLEKGLVGKYIDISEYAWPYLLGRAEGIAARDILIAAEAGNRSGDSLKQAKRLLRNGHGNLPQQVFILFAGNDLCSQNLDANPEQVQNGWENRTFEGVKALVEKGNPSATGTDFYIVTPLRLSLLVDEEAILNKKTFAFGEERTCREFREFKPQTQNESDRMTGAMALVVKYVFKSGNNLPEAASECRSVLTLKKGSPYYDAKLGKLKTMELAYQRAAEGVVETATEWIRARGKSSVFRAHLLRSPLEFSPGAEDIANDCFHLSLTGAEQLARLLKKELEEGR